MAFVKTLFIFFLLSGILSALLWQYGHQLFPAPPIPELKDGWWGSKSKESLSQDTSIKPFKINIPEEVITDLKKRLQNVPLTEPLEGVNFEYGFNTKYLKEVITYWQTKYDWRKQEKWLNKFDGFKTNIEGISVHFLHVKPNNVPKNVKVIPLLMIHGWPGSLVEFYKIIPLLTTPKKEFNFVFEIICPHIPGYGFSEAPHQPGFGAIDAAQLFRKLMERLGFKNYFVQGGDWGSLISTIMATLYPDKISGLHLNLVGQVSGGQMLRLFIGQLFPSLIASEKDYKFVYPLSTIFSNLLRESGYMHLQGTKPDTVGVALRDSPAGLAAYLMEKFSTWTNVKYIELPDGGLTKKFTLDELLTNVMVYWVSGSITSSMRFYKESFLDFHYKIDSIPVTVPTGVASFPEEFFQTSEIIARHQFPNVIHYSHMERGGHFAAFEEPALLADDIYSFVDKVQNLNADGQKK